MPRLVVFGMAAPKNAAEVAVMLASSPGPKKASRNDCVSTSCPQYAVASCVMAVCWAVRNASIRDAGGSDCCSELYRVETVGFVIGTPVMADMERFRSEERRVGEE